MEFIPKDKSSKQEIPTYDEVKGRSQEGWQGHTTGATVPELKSQISAAMGRLGGLVTGFQEGHILDVASKMRREAVLVTYTISNETGDLWPGKIIVAALPVDRKSCQNEQSYRSKCDKSLRMALYMLVTALQGAWNMQILSPGYSPLIPWMLANETGETMSEVFHRRLTLGNIHNLLPAPETEEKSDILDGEFSED